MTGPYRRQLQKANELLYINYLEKKVSSIIEHTRNHSTINLQNAKFTQPAKFTRPTTVLKLIFTQSFPKSTAAYLTAEGQQAQVSKDALGTLTGSKIHICTF